MTTPSEKDSILLCNDRLKVEIAQPGTIYRGTRFDWTGFITQVTLDGRHTFCAGETSGDIISTGGIGLCNEFSYDMPIGFEDSWPGQTFPKLGIGLLTRPDEENYSFFRPYEIAQPFPIRVDALGSHARFVVEPLECRGYEARLEKTVAIQGNELTIRYRLENTGRQPIHTHEYCHNFLCIDGYSIGPEYRLSFPYSPRIEPLPEELYKSVPEELRKFIPQTLEEAMILDGQEFRWREIPQNAYYGRLVGYSQTDQAQWELTHLPSRIAVGETDDFPPSRLALWGRAHVASAEVFVDIHIQPGEVQTWSRRYEFFETSPS